MDNVMIDLETLGTDNDSAIISIGACYFDPYSNVIGREFSQNIDFVNAVNDRKVDGSTIKWWLQQSQEARSRVTESGDLLSCVLFSLGDFLNSSPKDVKVWAKGPTFDLGILAHAFNQVRLNIPWKYHNERCVRTILDLSRKTLPRTNVAHCALHDAIYQAQQVQFVYKGLK